MGVIHKCPGCGEILQPNIRCGCGVYILDYWDGEYGIDELWVPGPSDPDKGKEFTMVVENETGHKTKLKVQVGAEGKIKWIHQT